MSKEDGGPAYPVSGSMWREDSRGMSLRDWFAGMANENDIIAQQDKMIIEETGEYPNLPPEPLTRAQARYMHADDMIKKRENERD